jgi:putative addiction module component (TIGR02574 family)
LDARHPTAGATIKMMPRNLVELFREAAQLPEGDRATLAGLLIESLEPAPEPDVEAAWSQEIARRVAEIEAGAVETIPWQEVHAEVFGRRNDRQVPSGGS